MNGKQGVILFLRAGGGCKKLNLNAQNYNFNFSLNSTGLWQGC